MLIVLEREPAAGHLPGDETCFHTDYQHCGPERQDWPRILYQYKPDKNLPSRVKPGKLRTPEGYVVLNIYNESILDFPSVPVTISSQCEGWRLEAFHRSNKWVTTKQIRSRMPRDINMRASTLSMRRTRFRKKAGAITWDTSGEESETIEDYMNKKLPQACKAANSIEAFRNLRPYELVELDLLNIGTCPMRSRVKDMSVEKHQDMRDALLQKRDKLLAKFREEYSGVIEAEQAMEEDRETEQGSSHAASTGTDGDWENDSKPDGSDKSEGEEQDSLSENSSYSGIIWSPYPGNQEVESSGEPRDNPELEELEGSSESRENPELEYTDEHDRSSIIYQSIALSDSEEGNFLHENPATRAGARLIKRLLKPTRYQFRSICEIHPPATNRYRSYIHQWGDIATAFRREFEMISEPPDSLIGLLEYTALTQEWNLPWHYNFGTRPESCPGFSELFEKVFAERALRSAS